MSTRRLPHPRAEDGLRPVTFIFDHPTRYPDLYLADHRYDPHHLNASGAELFTVLLADQLAPHLAAVPR